MAQPTPDTQTELERREAALAAREAELARQQAELQAQKADFEQGSSFREPSTWLSACCSP